MIKITFPDGSVREYEKGITGLQIAESISSRLVHDVLACGVNATIIGHCEERNDKMGILAA